MPRFIWLNKNWNLKQAHFAFFNYIKDLLIRWYKEIKTEGSSGRSKKIPQYKHPRTKQVLDYDSFIALNDEEKFQACFSTLTEKNWQEVLSERFFNQEDLPYQLKIENVASYMSDCHFCGGSSCRGCPLPYSSTTTILDMLHKVGVEDNVSFYNGKKGKSDMILNLVWNKDFEKLLQRHLSGVEEGKRVDTSENEKEEKNSEISISDCFDEFKKPEILDEDNMWYCSKCQKHVQATKKLEIYKAPPIIVINLKRFKQGRSSSRYFGMFGGGGGGQKLDQHVQFPLDGLDLSQYVIGKESLAEGKMIYDCYAVSNHFGQMGFGHYTAYAKNPITDKWYEFDDSRVSQVNSSQLDRQIVTNAAYNLFYRRRDWHERNRKEGVDFEKLSIKPDMSYVQTPNDKQ